MLSAGGLSEHEAIPSPSVNLSHVTVTRGKTVILDEPCAGLDPVAREHFLQFLQRFGKRRNAPTLLLATHHIEEIMPVFSHVLILKEGRVFAAGPRKTTLTARNLSRAFNARLKLSGRGLVVTSSSRIV